MRRRAGFALALVAVLTACAPRGVAPLPPAPAEALPAPVEEAVEVERAARARELFEEGVVLGRQGRWAEAERRYRDAAALEPAVPAHHLALADALLSQGRDWEGADALLAGIRAEEARPTASFRVLVVDYERLIRLLERLGRRDEAREARERLRTYQQLRDAQAPR